MDPLTYPQVAWLELVGMFEDCRLFNSTASKATIGFLVGVSFPLETSVPRERSGA
jgi:hypothetical protein